MKSNIRNFCIIAHIDHGKSTLADRFLELTKTIEKRKMRDQVLDSMDLERERGITIKMQPVRMIWNDFMLNLIDTPGHVDFSYEVSRALAAVEGAILLVDATKGVQAQTLANAKIAIGQGLMVIPAINKIDLAQARIEETEREVEDLLLSLDYMPDKIFHISSKTGEGVEDLLNAVIEKIPAPNVRGETPYIKDGGLRALIFDSLYDSHKGVIAHIRVVDGEVSKGDNIVFSATEIEASIKELGYFTPQPVAAEILRIGEIGYIATGLKDAEKIKIGDTVCLKGKICEALPGYKEPHPVVFASVFPETGDQFESLKAAVLELKLSDSSLYSETDYSETFGRGIKFGYLGMLHMEITLERLRREFDVETVVTAPSVIYKVEKRDSEEIFVYTPSKFPDASNINRAFEPYANIEILTPMKYLSGVMSLLKDIRGEHQSTESLGKDIMLIRHAVPLADIITDFYDKLKSVSSGFASLSYELSGFKEADIVKMEILLAGEDVESLARMVPRKIAQKEGKRIVDKLKEAIPKEQFAVAIQARVGGKIIARATKSAMRKDVTGYLYGGDYSRKRKLLEKQKKGKKRLREHGRVHLSSDTFMKLFR